MSSARAREAGAVAEDWTPQRLVAGTRYTGYYTIEAKTVDDLGYELWPTDTFTNRVPHPTNPVHFDIVVVRGLELVDVAQRTGTPAQRRELRTRLLPPFERLLECLQGPHPLYPQR